MITLRLSQPDFFDPVRDGLSGWSWVHPRDDEQFLNVSAPEELALEDAVSEIARLVAGFDEPTRDRWRRAEPALDHGAFIHEDQVANGLRLSASLLSQLSNIGVQFWSSVYCCSEPSTDLEKPAP